MPDDRDELIAALRQLTAFTEGLLTLSERLVTALRHGRPPERRPPKRTARVM